MPTDVLPRSIAIAPPEKDAFSTLILSTFALVFALALAAAVLHPAMPPAGDTFVVSGP